MQQNCFFYKRFNILDTRFKELPFGMVISFKHSSDTDLQDKLQPKMSSSKEPQNSIAVQHELMELLQ